MKKNFSSNLPTDGFLQCQGLHHYFHSKWEWVQLKILEKDLLGGGSVKHDCECRGQGNFVRK